MKRKVASRFLLPTEMLLGLLAIMIGLSGKMSEGVLFRALFNNDDVVYWVGGFCFVGFAQVIAALAEWQCGRKCNLEWVFRFVTARLWISFLAGACWIIASMYLLVAAQLMISLTFVSPICLVFCAWSYVENYKVKDALDADVSTDTIIFHR